MKPNLIVNKIMKTAAGKDAASYRSSLESAQQKKPYLFISKKYDIFLPIVISSDGIFTRI